MGNDSHRAGEKRNSKKDITKIFTDFKSSKNLNAKIRRLSTFNSFNSNHEPAYKPTFNPYFLSAQDKKDIFDKIELNDKMHIAINQNSDSDKLINVEKLNIKAIAGVLHSQIDPYMRFLKNTKTAKYDEVNKIENGDIIKDELGKNFMSQMIPGNFLNFNNSNTTNLKSAQPRYIKK